MADSEDDPSTRRWCHTSLRRVLVSEGCWAILLVENPKVCVHFGSWIALRGPRKWALALKRDGYANDTLSGDKQKSCCSWRTQKVWKRCFVWSDAELRLFSQVLAGVKVTGAAWESNASGMDPPPPHLVWISPPRAVNVLRCRDGFLASGPFRSPTVL